MTFNILRTTALAAFFAVAASCSKTEKLDKEINFPAAYVVNGEDHSISVINLNTDEVVATSDIKDATWPHHIYLSPDKKKLAVSCPGIDMSEGHVHGHGDPATPFLLVLDAENLKMLECSKNKVASHNAIFINGGSEIWAGSMESPGEVIIYDGKKLKEKDSFDAGNEPLEITLSHDNSTVFVANGQSNNVMAFDPNSKALKGTIEVGKSPVGAWPGSNNKMYVDNEASKTVYEIDVATLAVTDTIGLGYTPAYVSYNGKYDELWVTDADGGRVVFYKKTAGHWKRTSALETGRNAHAIGFTADLEKAYITNQFSDNVSVIKVADHSKIKDIPVGKKPNGIAIRE